MIHLIQNLIGYLGGGVLQEWAYQSRDTNDPCFHLGPILAIASDMPSNFIMF
jgi:hypothetical protein